MIEKPLKILSRKSNLRSTTGLLSFGEGPQELLLHYKRADREPIEREARELARAASVTVTVNGIRPIQLRECLPEKELLLTEYVAQPQSLFNYLWNGSRWWGRRDLAPLAAEEVGMRVGSWLRAYHASTLVPVTRIAKHVERIAEGVAGKLRAIDRHNPRMLSTDLKHGILGYMDRVVCRSEAWGPQNVARIHGDLDLANVLIDTKGELFIVDFADTYEGFALHDLARMWHAVWAVSRISRRRDRVLRPCLDALLTAYGQPRTVLESPLFEFLRCWNAVALILGAAMAPSQFGFSGNRVVKRLARVNREWLESMNWVSY